MILHQRKQLRGERSAWSGEDENGETFCDEEDLEHEEEAEGEMVEKEEADVGEEDWESEGEFEVEEEEKVNTEENGEDGEMGKMKKTGSERVKLSGTLIKF